MKFKENCLPVVILLIICIVCVGLLAVLNDLWFVTDAEKFNRALREIYPVADATFEKVELVSGSTSNDTYGEVKTVYGASDGGYVIEAQGKGGFNNGTATLYVAISSEAKIVGWSIKDNVGQTYVSNITKNHLATWYIGSDISKVIELNADVTCAGTSKTSTAINSAINMACEYARTQLGLGENPQGEALNALTNALVGTDYATAELAVPDAITANAVTSKLLIGDVAASYTFTAVVEGKLVIALAYEISGEMAYVVLVPPVGDSGIEYVFTSDSITAQNKTDLSNLVYAPQAVDADNSTDSRYGETTFVAVDAAGNASITSVGKGGFENGTVTANINVDIEGKITSIAIVDNKSQSFIGKLTQEEISQFYVGKMISESFAVGDATVAGATMSSTALSNAVNMSAQYARVALGMGENPEADALNMITAGLVGTDYAAAEFAPVVATYVEHLVIGDAKPDYAFVASVNSKTIYALTYGEEYVVFVQSLVDAERVVVANSDGFTQDMQDIVTATYFDTTAVVISVADGDSVKGHKMGGYIPGAYTLTVTIVSGEVTEIDISVNGFVPFGPSEANANELATTLIGSTLATINEPVHVSGATQSANMIRAAVELALQHADANA